jgi:hypothetical protein
MKRIQKAAVAAVAGVVGLLAGQGAASASLTCSEVEPGVIEVDAALDDWRDLTALRRGQRDPDASFELRCAFAGQELYLSVRLRDERLIRTGRADGRGEDALHLSLRATTKGAGWKMTFLPGTRGFRARRVGGDGARADDSLLEDGWQFELALPLARMPGWGPSTPLLLGDVWYADIDRAGAAAEAKPRIVTPLHFSSHVAAERGFLSVAGLSPRELRLDQLADIDGLPGTERAVAGGRHLAVLTDSFAFIELPLDSPADLRRVELIDFDGDGRSSILAHYRQRGGGGSREVVTVWRVAAGGELERALAFEVAVELDGRVLANRWSLVPAGEQRAGSKPKRARAGGGLDILVEVGPQDNAGWDAASFARLTPSPDARAILTPWSGKRAVVYYFDGEEALEAAARAARPRRAR